MSGAVTPAASYGIPHVKWDGALGMLAREAASQTGNILITHAPADREATQFTFQCPLCRKCWSGCVEWHWDREKVVSAVFALAEQHDACALALGPAGRPS